MFAPLPLRELPAAQQIIQMLFGTSVSQAISLAADLGVVDLITSPKTVEELAAATSTHGPSLYRLLRALASIGVFSEIDERRFTLTPLAACLRSDAPDSIRNTARLFGLPLISRGLGAMLHCVQPGETGIKQALGATDQFAYLSQHPHQTQPFH